MKAKLTQEIINRYYNYVLPNVQLGNAYVLKDFRAQYPDESRQLLSMVNKRSKIRKNVHLMQHLGNGGIAWFTLNYRTEKRNRLETTKRKELHLFLDEMFDCWLFVEEMGSNDDFYHIHGFGVFKKGIKLADDFGSTWCKLSGHNKTRLLNGKDIDKRVRYVTKYASKEIPTIHRSKSLIMAEKCFKKHVKLLHSNFVPTYNRITAPLVEEMGLAFIPFEREQRFDI